jgi:D-ribulokinase
MEIYLGLDFGTSGARVMALDISSDGSLHLVAQASSAFTEQTTSQWQTHLFDLLRSIPEAVRQRVCAIAINGTSSTVVLCDRAGQPVDQPILYHDARGAEQLPALKTYLAQQPVLPHQTTVLSATSSLAKLLWWQQQPCFAEAAYLLHQADWLAFLLHGQLGLSDYHNSLKLGYDVRQLCYPEWLLGLSVAPLLPRVLPPGTPIAPLRPEIAQNLGFPSHCQVCAGTTDSIAAFLASGASTPGEAVTSLGSTLVLKLLSHTPVDCPEYGIYSHRLGDLWLVGGASNTGGAVLKQFFSDAELAQLSEQISPTDPCPWDYYPLTQPGERFPINDPHLPPRLEPRPADPAQFLHGLLDSMARIEAEGYRRLQQLGATPLSHVYTAGGGAKNATWMALRSRHLAVPVDVSAQTEAAYGTAVLAVSGQRSAVSG